MLPVGLRGNLEVVLQYTDCLEEAFKQLSEKHSKLLEQLAPEQQWLAESYRDQLCRLKTKFFGFGRETLPEQSKPRPIGRSNEELNVHTERRTPEELKLLEVEPRTSSLQQHSPVERVLFFRDEELQAESQIRGVNVGKDAWKEIPGLYQQSSEITIIERTYQKVIYKQAKYRLKDEFNTTGKEVIITAPGPAKLRANSRYSIDFAVAVVTDKYDLHMPLERQRRKMETAGLDIDVKTLYGLCEAVAEHGESVREGIRQDILDDYPSPHLDESPWNILNDKKQGYLWVMSNRTGCYYQFEPTRSGLVPEEMLKGYEGAVVTDAYAGYHRIGRSDKIRIQNCWSHGRREFYERYSDFPKEVTEVLEIIDRVFEIEARARSPEQLKELRKTESRQAVLQLQEWLYGTLPKFLPTEGISKAIQYWLKNWKGLTHFLTDLTVEIQNNDAERALRHAIIGRKNFAGSRTINGADTAATLYTIIETCKRNAIQPTEYLNYLITERWHNRKPQTPFQYVVQRRGLSQKVVWPDRSQWRID
jgi:hypothetical protein